MSRRVLLAVWLSLALSGCVVGPNYVSPASNAPAQTPFASAASPAFTGDEPDGQWWQLFRDPTLDALVRELGQLEALVLEKTGIGWPARMKLRLKYRRLSIS